MKEFSVYITNDNREAFDVIVEAARAAGLTEIAVEGASYVVARRPEPIGETEPLPPQASHTLSVAPYQVTIPTKLKFVGRVTTYRTPSFSAPTRVFEDGRTVDVIDIVENGGRVWWCVFRTTLNNGELYELWIPAGKIYLEGIS